MSSSKTLLSGIIGTIITIICCTSPVLVILLGAIGLGAFTGYLDYVLIPTLVIFLSITIVSYRKRTSRSKKTKTG
ncbi:mercury resistance system transport protein MerF [Guptibacillus algicola]|uniref:mercury resistance system transport protein MerF n=1 Tax=Guptibacillus algicola TaxID=225844 RepID=UPI001CD72F58|nr:mercury resistance system transport protein MerF [Alkalihalobacillus algicola]MCA0987161.1 mercury resistance system transport protein MerF [Alkalihalobacillus algicola]